MKKKILLGLLLGFIYPLAYAEESAPYVSIDAGQGTVRDACTGYSSISYCTDKATVYRLGIGNQITPYISVEMDYMASEKIKAVGTSSGTAITQESKYTGFNFSFIGAQPLTSNFSLLGKLGMIFGKSTTLSNSTSLSAESEGFTLGLGAQYKLSKVLAMRIMYEDFGVVQASGTSPEHRFTMIGTGLLISY